MRDPEDRPSFTEAIQALAAVYRVEPTQGLLMGYWYGLRNMELADVQAAVMRACESGGRSMPMPEELRAMGGAITPAMRAVKAWQAVKGAVAKCGAYKSVDFSDPAINATIRALGGWTKVCDTPSEEFDKWTSKDFTRIYGEYIRHGTVTAEEGRYLGGLHELHNNAHGHQVAAPVRIDAAVPATKLLGAVAPGVSGNVRALINAAIKER